MASDLSVRAREVLEGNRQDGFTIPCEGLYPCRWNWDSGFIALGWGHLDMERADFRQKEVLILLVFFILILSYFLQSLYA